MIKGRKIFKSFGEPPTHVLKGIDVEVKDGEFVSLVGRSGSGKSTLLYILSTLDVPTLGEVFYEGRSLTSFSPNELYDFRNKKIGFVFQFHYLIQELSALENVLLPARKAKEEKIRLESARQLLKEVGLEGKEQRLPSELSGGEQQRVAIARALIMNPSYIFADEPTGNLDSVNATMVMELFRKINKENKTTVLYVTHDKDFAAFADRSILMVDGLLS